MPLTLQEKQHLFVEALTLEFIKLIENLNEVTQGRSEAKRVFGKQ